jgi:cell division protein FtsL
MSHDICSNCYPSYSACGISKGRSSGMTARVGNLGSFVFERGRRGNLRRIIMMLLIIGGLLLYVGGKVTIMRVGYQIEALQREKREMERENSSLKIESSSLTSSARIEEIATKRLGMIRPTEDNVVIVKRKTAPRQ